MLPPTVKAERTAAPAPPHDQNKEAEQQFHLTFDRRDYVAIALLVLGVAAMFWRVLFTSQMFYFRDVYNYTYPHVKFIHDAIRAGYLPYWNPLLNYGEPVLADPNFLFFYPTTLLIVLLPVAYAYCLHYVLHFAIAAVGTYYLARRWNQSRAAALFAAAAFAFSGPLLSLGNFYNHAACAAWIPWALLATDSALRSRRTRPWIWLTGVFTLQFLAGEMFTLLATFVLCFAYALFQATATDAVLPLALYGRGNAGEGVVGEGVPGTVKTVPFRWNPNFRLLGRILVAFSVVGLAMVGLCAVQLLPASHLLAASRRGLQGMPYNETTYWSLNPLSLLETVVPGFFGWPLDGLNLWSFVLDGRNYPYLVSLFTGFVVLFFAFLGWVFSKDRRCKFAAAGAAALVLLSFGRFTPVFALVYLLFPPLELVRFPVKLLVPAGLLAALLAGWGLDALRDSQTDWRAWQRWIVNPIACLLAITLTCLGMAIVAPGRVEETAAWILTLSNDVYARSQRSHLAASQIAEAGPFVVAMVRLYFPGLAGFLLGALAWFAALERKRAWARRAVPGVALFGIAHLMWVNYAANPTVPKAFYTYRPPVLSAMNPSGRPYRVCALWRKKPQAHHAPNVAGFLNFESIPFVARLPLTAQNDFRNRIVLSHATMLTGDSVILNNDVDLSFPTELFDFWVFIGAQMPVNSRADCLLGRTNVKYEILDHRQHSRTLRLAGRIFNGSSAPSYLYENACFTPRAYVARAALKCASPLESLTMLSNPNFDPEQNVILPSRRGRCLPSSKASLVPRSPPGTVTILSRTPNTVVLQANMQGQGYLVLLDRYDPGWQTWVDGQTAAILRANLMFRAVRLTAGKHVVRFEYHQPGLRAGLAITFVTLAVLVLLFATDGSALAPWAGILRRLSQPRKETRT